jgi:hypothetical protein
LQGQYAAETVPFQKSFAALAITYATGQPMDASATVKSFPIKLRTVWEYAQRVVGAAS